MNAVTQTNPVKAKIPAAARLFLSFLQKLSVGNLTIITPDKESLFFKGKNEGYEAELHINDWSALSTIIKSGDIGVAEVYRDHKIDTPDLLKLLLLALDNQDVLEKALHGSFWGTLFYRLKHIFFNRNSRSGSKKNIHAHYDIGNNFYRLWLDPSMTYSSAFFDNKDISLEAAQKAKYQRILDMLNLKPGDHILEIGCGWGGFAELACQQGLKVTGISLSKEQLAYAHERFKDKPYAHLAEFRFEDYRDTKGHFDAVVSIEMFEAVGEAYWPTYFQTVKDRLKPGANAAIQTITINDDIFEDYRRGTDFIQQYIFPGGMLPSPTILEKQLKSVELNLQNMHFFGLDYAKTLLLWREKFETVLSELHNIGFDDSFIRIWRFYYCYCEAGFLTQRTNVCQMLIHNAV